MPDTQTAVSMQQLFEAYREVEPARKRLEEAKAEAQRLKDEFAEAREAVQAAHGAWEQAQDRVFEVLGELAPSAGPPRPMGWIDATTRPGRRFVLADSRDRVEFRGIGEGDRPQLFIADGMFAGEPFFPAGPPTVEEWNREWAGKVEGFTDVATPDTAGPPPPHEGKEAAEAPAEATSAADPAPDLGSTAA